MNKHFSKEDIQMVTSGHRHIKRCSTSLIREIQIKVIGRYHLTPVRVAKMNKSGDYRYWRECGETGTLLHCGNANWCSSSGKTDGGKDVKKGEPSCTAGGNAN